MLGWLASDHHDVLVVCCMFLVCGCVIGLVCSAFGLFCVNFHWGFASFGFVIEFDFDLVVVS